jgi:hypothetical protein
LGLCATALALWGLWALMGLCARNVARGGWLKRGSEGEVTAAYFNHENRGLRPRSPRFALCVRSMRCDYTLRLRAAGVVCAHRVLCLGLLVVDPCGGGATCSHSADPPSMGRAAWPAAPLERSSGPGGYVPSGRLSYAPSESENPLHAAPSCLDPLCPSLCRSRRR